MKTTKLQFALLLTALLFFACQKNEGPEICLKGKVIATRCMGTIVQITQGNFDASLVTAKWRDSLKVRDGQPAPELNNVFRLINPCKHALREGDEFYFTIKAGETEDTCAYCLALDILPPPRANAITICAGTTSK